VKPTSLDQCKKAIEEFVDYIRANEPETRMYTALNQSDDLTKFLHFFVFEDEAARDRHSNSEAVQRFTAILYSECLAPVEFTEYQLVAAR
jgi:quinol monooxygenase YgiN